MPSLLTALRRVATVTRWLSGEWCGVDIVEPYLPQPTGREPETNSPAARQMDARRPRQRGVTYSGWPSTAVAAGFGTAPLLLTAGGLIGCVGSALAGKSELARFPLAVLGAMLAA